MSDRYAADRFAAWLKQADGAQIAGALRFHQVEPLDEGEVLSWEDAGFASWRRLFGFTGLSGLYRHQVQAAQAILDGRDIVLATGTASGKTLAIFLPLFERMMADGDTRALACYPMRALERDQARVLSELAALAGLGPRAVAVLDGDTSPYRRRKLKASPPRLLITTPDMLHYGILAYHEQWTEFLSHLEFLFLDEIHSYRGLFGSHVALVIRRLGRLVERSGSRLQMVAASATVGNPGNLASLLFGQDRESPRVIDQSAAPRGRRHYFVIKPTHSGHRTAFRLLVEGLDQGLRTILFTKSRRVTELIYTWLVGSRPDLAARVSSYRGGYRAEERREIEAGLSSGRLLGVISTSALELGIDIGGLDLCILAGYPGSMSSLFQRSGRVGRGLASSVTVLVTLPDALDGYFLHHPQELFARGPESVALDPDNPYLLADHLPCAAAEEPLTEKDWVFQTSRGREALARCLEDRTLVRSADGMRYFPSRTRPHRRVDLRSAGEGWTLLESESGEVLGNMSGHRVWAECHPEAVYLHRARPYLVESLDPQHRFVRLRQEKVSYYTEVRSEKETSVLEIFERRRLDRYEAFFGRLEVTERIVGFVRRHLGTKRIIETRPLELPESRFETQGLWIVIRPELADELAASGRDLMGSIHATEHALIGLFPLFVFCDRDDVGGISMTRHPATSGPTVFVYDGYRGGAGLAHAGFERLDAMLRAVGELLEACPCDNGCPSCVQSPKCGNGNQPLDKAGSLFLVQGLAGSVQVSDRDGKKLESEAIPRHYGSMPQVGRIEEVMTVGRNDHKDARQGSLFSSAGQGSPSSRRQGSSMDRLPADPRILVFDLETMLSAQEVGGFQHAERMRLAVGVVYDSAEHRFFSYWEQEADDLLDHLWKGDLVCGFNSVKFDYKVLSAYTDRSFATLPSFDILADIHQRLGFRLKLDTLASNTLGVGKSADGLQSLEWVRQGKMDLVRDYCIQDVTVTRDLFLFGLSEGYLLYRDKRHGKVRLEVDWDLPTLVERAARQADAAERAWSRD